MGPATVDDLADKAHLLCLSGTKGSSRESEFPDFTVVAGDLGQALQGADIRGEADVDLGHAKLGVGRAQTDIACGCNVYGEAEGEAVEGADDGLAAGGEGGDGCLEGTEVGVEGEGLAGGVGGRGGEEGLGVDYGQGQRGGRGGDARSRPAVKAASEVELRTRTRMAGSAEAWRTMWASSVHILRGQRGGGRCDVLIVERVYGRPGGGLAGGGGVSVGDAPVELEEQHAGCGAGRCVQFHRGGSWGGGEIGRAHV